MAAEIECPVVEEADGCVMYLYVTPRASKTRLAGMHGQRLKLQVAAPPVDGKANDEVLRYLASALHVAQSAVTLRAGHTSKCKAVAIKGRTLSAVRDLLGI